MARSPFQGTYQYGIRPTVAMAPDAVVYINGNTDIQGCPSCRKRFDWNKYITSIQVDLSVDSVPGTATISLSIPRHTIDDFFFDGNPIITPMMEVEIYAKGYYLVEGVPQYYPIFWGLITEVNDAYSGGEHTVSLHCADILKWWELCKMNINPAFTAPAGQQGRSLFGNVFFGMNPYDVIWTLAQASFGDVVVGTGSLISLYKEQGGQKQVFDAALSDIMLYWEERFSRIRSNVMLYGVNGTAIRGDSLYEAYRHGKKGTLGRPFASQAVRSANGGKDGGQMVFDPTDPNVVAFRTQFQNAGQVNFWQSEYQTKLELANAAKEAIGFEFYMDVDGSIVFKPPFYNLDVLSNKPLSWIQDIDIIDWDFSESEAEVVTQVQMQGSFGGSIDYGMPQEVTPFTSVTDYHLLRKYGWRTHTYNSEFLGDPMLMFYHGMDILDRLNSKRHRGSVSIPLRPELRLGFPIYLAPKDQMWYVTGISHNIQFGGRAQTTLALTAKRSKFFAPKGIGTLELSGWKDSGGKVKPAIGSSTSGFPYTSKQLSKGGTFNLKIGEAAQLPPAVSSAQSVGQDNPYAPLVLRHPKTGKFVGYPNVVMAYTRPFTPNPDDLSKNKGQKTGANPMADKKVQANIKKTAAKLSDYLDSALQASDHDRLREKHLTNRYQYGLNSAGVYVYAYEKTKVIGEIVLVPTKNLTVTPETKTKVFPGSTAMIRPVSDERGFEVIGHFRYGRGISLRDGNLVGSGSAHEKANVDVQFALSGDLFASLNAQSQGLTSITTVYPSPADAVARLQPDELQTAGIINPDTKQAEFVNTGTNFVDSAPIGSPEQKGVPSNVEAGQLSRALTLAELTLTKDLTIPNDTCPCTLGRGDLAFINVGYQVKILKGASPDTSGLPDTSGATSVVGNQGFLNGGDPVSPTMAVPSPEKVASIVDTFLFNLYQALDEPHQQYEKQLRGDIITEQNGPDPDFTQPQPPNDFAPPFSTPNRAALGDLAAIEKEFSTAADDLTSSWKSFGDDLRKSAERARLHGEIQSALADLIGLEKEKTKLEQQIASGSAVSGDLESDLNAVNEQIDKLRQMINADQLALALLG
jgi:hypothetical protein